MKKLIALLTAFLMLAAPALAQEAASNSLENAAYRARVAEGAKDLVRIVTASVSDEGFLGAPDPYTAWATLGQYVAPEARDGQVFTDAELSSLYADLFAQGQFHQISGVVGSPFRAAEGGYAFQAADGDPTYYVVGNATDSYSEESIYYDVSLYTLGHDDYPMTFMGNAVAVLTPSASAAYGARIAGWMPGEMPIFPRAESSAQLGDQEGNTYAPANAIDEDRKTCWAYPLADGQGVSLTLLADETQQVRGLVLTPGYAKSAYAFSSNRRVAKLRVTLSDGASFTLSLPDVDKDCFDGTYVLPFDGLYDTREVVLEVLDTYEGDRFDDVCISEVYLF